MGECDGVERFRRQSALLKLLYSCQPWSSDRFLHIRSDSVLNPVLVDVYKQKTSRRAPS